MNYLLFLLIIPALIQPVFAQEYITVNQTEICFLNATAGYQMFENCNADDDWLKFMVLPFEWVTGGYFSLILVSVIILAVYQKYHKAIYAILIGLMFIPISYSLFPDTWINFALIMGGFVAGLLIFKALYRQTKEY